MGMFDTIHVEYPVPGIADFRPFSDQTKELDCALDEYKIDASGQFLHQAYDTVDRSDPNAKGLKRFVGSLSRENLRWEPCPLTGSLSLEYDDTREVVFWIVDGVVRDTVVKTV